MSKQLTADKIIGTDFKFIISDLAYQKVMYWVNKSDHEVSGFGPVEYDAQSKTYTITDAFLIGQENGPTSSEIDPAALGKSMFKKKDVKNAHKWWWHSHVNMNVFWSGDDMNCIRGLGQRGWITATVFNKKCEMRSAFYCLTEVMGNNHEIFVDEVPTQTLRFLDKEFMEACDAEYAENVKEKKYQYAGYSGGYQSQWDDDYPFMGSYRSNYHTSPRNSGKSWSENSGKKIEGIGNGSNGSHSGTGSQIPLAPGFAPEDDWDDAGYRNVAGIGLVYNPVQDPMLSDKDKWQEVLDMPMTHYDFCFKDDPMFRSFVDESTRPPYLDEGPAINQAAVEEIRAEIKAENKSKHGRRPKE